MSMRITKTFKKYKNKGGGGGGGGGGANHSAKSGLVSFPNPLFYLPTPALEKRESSSLAWVLMDPTQEFVRS